MLRALPDHPRPGPMSLACFLTGGGPEDEPPSVGDDLAMPHLLVRPPSSRLAAGELTHLERQGIDVDLAREQWGCYVAAMAAAGYEPVELPGLEEHPDGVFVEDVVVVLRGSGGAAGTAVLTRPGADSRRGEVATVRGAVERLGLEVREITSAGTLDGGDVLEVGSTLYVGQSTRTDAEGARQLAAIAAPLGYDVVLVPMSAALHLKSAVTALPDGTVIGYPPLVDDPLLFHRFLAVLEAEGTAVVVLGEERVLMSDSAPRTAVLLRERGLDVVTVPVSEFEKLEGCVTCLSVRLPRR